MFIFSVTLLIITVLENRPKCPLRHKAKYYICDVVLSTKKNEILLSA